MDEDLLDANADDINRLMLALSDAQLSAVDVSGIRNRVTICIAILSCAAAIVDAAGMSNEAAVLAFTKIMERQKSVEPAH